MSATTIPYKLVDGLLVRDDTPLAEYEAQKQSPRKHPHDPQFYTVDENGEKIFDYDVHYLTTNMERIMRFVTRFVDLHRFAPSQREIMRGTGIEFFRAVVMNLNYLDRYGWIEKSPNVHRGIVLLKRLE